MSSYANLDARTDAIISSFNRQLEQIVAAAAAQSSVRLRDVLDVADDGSVKPTASNVRQLRKLPDVFRQSLRENGYDRLVTQFSSSFDGGLDVLEQILSRITRNYQLSPVTLSPQDLSYLQALRQGVVFSMEQAVQQAGEAARRNTLFTMGGQPFHATAATIAGRLSVTMAQAKTLAATGISTFYRTAAAKGYDKIEDALDAKGLQLEYTYVGPGDVLTRPFCMRLVAAARGGRTWSRAQIDRMDNGQLPDAFTTCGGYNCRHQWAVALEA